MTTSEAYARQQVWRIKSGKAARTNNIPDKLLRQCCVSSPPVSQPVVRESVDFGTVSTLWSKQTNKEKNRLLPLYSRNPNLLNLNHYHSAASTASANEWRRSPCRTSFLLLSLTFTPFESLAVEVGALRMPSLLFSTGFRNILPSRVIVSE